MHYYSVICLNIFSLHIVEHLHCIYVVLQVNTEADINIHATETSTTLGVKFYTIYFYLLYLDLAHPLEK